MDAMARLLIVAGVTLALIGVVLQFFPQLLSWFGRLPGDIRIETEHSRVYIPIVSMLLVSAFLTVIVSLVKK